jgi:predicted nucleic acid-binding protein
VIVADASAILEVLLRTPAAAAIEARVLRDDETVHAPALLDLEVAQVLRRYVARGEVAPSRARAALDLLTGFPLERYAHEPLLPRIWELRASLTAYDAAYVALAEGLRAPPRHLRCAAGGRARHPRVDRAVRPALTGGGTRSRSRRRARALSRACRSGPSRRPPSGARRGRGSSTRT